MTYLTPTAQSEMYLARRQHALSAPGSDRERYWLNKLTEAAYSVEAADPEDVECYACLDEMLCDRCAELDTAVSTSYP